MSDDKQKSDPDNVFVTAGKADETKVYVFVPYNYRDAQAAIKEAGGTFVGSQWELGKEAFEGAEEKIREGARADIELGQDGRKAREDKIKADREAAKPSEEDKAAAREERKAQAREQALERDKTRWLVAADTVKTGDEIEVRGEDVPVTHVGKTFTLDEDGAADMAERFVGTQFEAGDEVAYATFEQPEAEPEADETPSM